MSLSPSRRLQVWDVRDPVEQAVHQSWTVVKGNMGDTFCKDHGGAACAGNATVMASPARPAHTYTIRFCLLETLFNLNPTRLLTSGG